MPKDWNHHEAEIERLYMVEGRTLKDVRDILRVQYGFDASIRAYRMKLDEWRLWKNNSQNQRRKTDTISRRQTRTIKVSEPPQNVPSDVPSLPAHIHGVTVDCLQVYGMTVPDGVIELPGILPLISNLRGDLGLEIMLPKWKSDGISIFHSIQEKTAPNEHVSLVKACVEASFKSFKSQLSQQSPLGPVLGYPYWLEAWAEACKASTWEMAKTALGRGVAFWNRTIGTFFLECCLAVIAKGFLSKNIDELDHLEARIENLNHSEERLAEICRRESMDILREFGNSKVDIDPKWYKCSLIINEWNDRLLAHSRARQRKQCEQLEEYRKKLLQLKNLYRSFEGNDGFVQNLLSAATLFTKSKNIVEAVQCEGLLLPDERLSSHQSTPTRATQVESFPKIDCGMQTVLGDIYTEWKWGILIGDDVRNLLERLSALFLSDPSYAEENLFVLISRIIPRNDQLPFTAVILAAADDVCGIKFPLEDEVDWAIWHQASTRSDLKELQKCTGLMNMDFLLDECISPDVVKMILDATVVLVGARFMSKLEAEIKWSHLLAATDYNPRVYDKYHREYMSILDMIQSRKLKLDQHWFWFLGSMLKWAATKWGDEVEMSEEESDGSGDDSVGSEDEPGAEGALFEHRIPEIEAG